jgi:hypothetical protein
MRRLPVKATASDAYTPANKWRFNETSGTSLTDVNSGLVLTASGGAALASGQVPSTTARPLHGDQPNYILLDGSNDKLQTAAAPAGLTAYGFLFAAWFYHVASGAGVPFAYGTSGNGWAWLYDTATSKLDMNRAGVGSVGDTGSNSVLTQTWYRVACWCPAAGVSAGMRLYLNGVLKTTCSAFAPSTNGSDLLSIGCVPGDTNFSNCRVARPLTLLTTVAATADLMAAADFAGQSATGIILP